MEAMERNLRPGVDERPAERPVPDATAPTVHVSVTDGHRSSVANERLFD
jgi:hypothetical protein